MNKSVIIKGLKFAGIFLCAGIVSCVHTQQVALKKEVTKTAVIKQADANRLLALEAKKERKFQQGEIDTVIKRNIESKLKKYNSELDSISRAIAYVQRASIYKPLYKDNKLYVTVQANLLKSFRANYNARLRRLSMIDTSLDWTGLHSFNLAAFFGPGKFDIPTDKLPQADKAFSPIIDSLVTFYNRYNDIERQATLVILGFADGIGFNPDTDTYRELANMLHQPNPPKELLNQKLSELRADKIGDVMELLLAKKINNFDSIRKVDFVFMQSGKGEQFPSKAIKDYKPDDERRRVVLFFWNILPK